MNAKGSPEPDGRRLRWQDHKAQRRQHVIDAAIAVLEERAPGAEVQVQEIADAAQMNRSVLYRHFTDRFDLDLSVQREVCSRVREVLLGAVSFDGTPRQIVRRIVECYVRWAVAHPALARFIERDVPGAPARPLDEAVEEVAREIEVIIGGFAAALGAQLSPGDRDALEPWVFGLVVGQLEAVKRWARRPELSPGVDEFVELLTSVAWHQVVGLAGDRGLAIPDLPIEDLLAAGGLAVQEP